MYGLTLLPISEFVLDEKFHRNASKFVIFYIYENLKLLFPFFISCKFIFPPNECPGLCRQNFEAFCQNFSSSTNLKIERSDITDYLLKLSRMPPTRNMVSITFNATKHKLNEFFILGLFKIYAAKIFKKTPTNATNVLATPSNQNANCLRNSFSVSDGTWHKGAIRV